MESKDVAPDLMTYSYLISCHVDCRQFEDAAELYKEMRNRLIRYAVSSDTRK
jgi:pentatricopeptide repeat protein